MDYAINKVEKRSIYLMAGALSYPFKLLLIKALDGDRSMLSEALASCSIS